MNNVRREKASKRQPHAVAAPSRPRTRLGGRMSGELLGTFEDCVAEDGLMKAKLGDLRRELGYNRLGKWILEEIAVKLESEGLGYFPRDVLDPRCNTEPRQWDEVWVYVRDDSTRARILDAILYPERNNVRSILDGLVGGDLAALTPREKLRRIAEIVQA